jgi:hypothetical protein
MFTLITITILSLFAITFTTYNLTQNRQSINTRITTLNNLVESIEQDLPRQTYISGYRAIFLMSKQIADTGDYITNVNNSLNELFFNATLDSSIQELMTDATFSSIQSTLQTRATKTSANLILQNPTISITQTDPWNLAITLNTTLIIFDNNNLASWNKTTSTTALIPITSFTDPIYCVNTGGRILHQINQTPYTTFVTGSDYTNLKIHFQNSLYKSSTSAPSFLNRLQGNLSSSTFGIESLVNPQLLADAGLSTKYKTLIDYIYFSNDDWAKYEVPAISNLILDDEDNHLEIYNVSGVAILI